ALRAAPGRAACRGTGGSRARARRRSVSRRAAAGCGTACRPPSTRRRTGSRAVAPTGTRARRGGRAPSAPRPAAAASPGGSPRDLDGGGLDVVAAVVHARTLAAAEQADLERLGAGGPRRRHDEA